MVLLSACGTAPATTTKPTTQPITIEGGTVQGSMADANTQTNVKNAVSLMETMAKSGCPNPRLVNAEVIQKPTAENGPWTERWNLDRCGKSTFSYTLTFTPDIKNGGAGFAIEPEKKAGPTPAR